MNKRGQVTIFIILALIIVSAILVYLLIVKPSVVTPPIAGKSVLEGCLEGATNSLAKELALKAGYMNIGLSYSNLGEKIPYLCYTNKYYEGCINQEPFLIQNFKTNLEKNLKLKVLGCYEESISELRRTGKNVIEGNPQYSIDIVPSRIDFKLSAPTSVQQEGVIQYSDFNFKFSSSLYEMLMIATSIIQSETSLGSVDTTIYMLNYPNYIITKQKESDWTSLYVIESKTEKIKFQFAVRSWAYPAGYGFNEGVYNV